MDNAAAGPATDAWHHGPQCAGDGGGGKTENSTREQQTQPHRSLNARSLASLPQFTTVAKMRTLLALAVITTVVGPGKAGGEASGVCCRLVEGQPSLMLHHKNVTAPAIHRIDNVKVAQ